MFKRTCTSNPYHFRRIRKKDLRLSGRSFIPWALDLRLKRPFRGRLGRAGKKLRGLPSNERRARLRRTRLFVGLRRDHLLAAVETGRADVVTTMDFAGRRFDSGRRIRQEVMSTMVTALVGGFFVLLNSHGKPHVSVECC